MTSLTSGGSCAPRCASAAASTWSPKPATATRPCASPKRSSPTSWCSTSAFRTSPGGRCSARIRTCSPDSKVVVFSGTETRDHEWIAENVEAYVYKDDELEYLVDLLVTVTERPDAEAVLDLPQALSSAGAARRFVREKIEDWGLDTLLDDALLVVSELAANAITHADSPCRIRLSRNSSALRIDVVDTGVGTPEPQPASFTEEHGRGLHLVSALTSAWGLDHAPDGGKQVWAELALPIDGAGQA